MGHRYFLDAPQTFEPESDQGWNHGQHPYIPIDMSAPESSSTAHPMDSMTLSGGHFHSQWAPAPRSSGFSSLFLNDEMPHHQQMSSCPPRDPVPCQTSSGINHVPQENYLHYPSSSNPVGSSVPGSDDSFNDQMVSHGRGSYKRKYPFPTPAPTCDRLSASKYSDIGSSSDMHLPGDRWQEKQVYHSNYWDYPPSSGASSLSLGSEGTHRNARSGGGVDLGANLPRTHLSNDFSHHSSAADIWGQNSNASTGWDHTPMPPPPTHWMAPGSDPSFTIHVPSSLNSLNSHANISAEAGSYGHDLTTNRRHTSQNISRHMNQPVRGGRNSYGQRSSPTIRDYSSNNRLGHLCSTEVHHTVGDNYPSLHPRASPNLRLRSMERNGRTHVSSDRYRRLPSDPGSRDQLMPVGHMTSNQPAVFYGSRALFDQHREMRLDVDNMTYEELLALGDRIGTVNTGLSDISISKCLIESIYCSSDAAQDEGNCIICLEEYKNMDDVASLKHCGHDFHVVCIRKWLSIKNLCPICKAAAMDDAIKKK